MDHEHWFVVTATYACPICQKLHTEKFALNSPAVDYEKLKMRVDSVVFACPDRWIELPKATKIAIHISPPHTRQSLESLGMEFRPLPGK